METFVELIGYLAVISVAAERITDIAKRLILERLKASGVIYQLVSGLFGGCIAYAAPPSGFFSNVHPVVLFIVIGLCVSGGSSVWNTLLSTMTELSKNLKTLKKPD